MLNQVHPLILTELYYIDSTVSKFGIMHALTERQKYISEVLTEGYGTKSVFNPLLILNEPERKQIHKTNKTPSGIRSTVDSKHSIAGHSGTSELL